MITLVAVLAAVWLAAYRLNRTLRSVERLVAALEEQLAHARHAQEHHQTELHRRLNGIEAAASRAEREARAVSDQLTNAMSVVS